MSDAALPASKDEKGRAKIDVMESLREFIPTVKEAIEKEDYDAAFDLIDSEVPPLRRDLVVIGPSTYRARHFLDRARSVAEKGKGKDVLAHGRAMTAVERLQDARTELRQDI